MSLRTSCETSLMAVAGPGRSENLLAIGLGRGVVGRKQGEEVRRAQQKQWIHELFGSASWADGEILLRWMQ